MTATPRPRTRQPITVPPIAAGQAITRPITPITPPSDYAPAPLLMGGGALAPEHQHGGRAATPPAPGWPEAVALSRAVAVAHITGRAVWPGNDYSPTDVTICRREGGRGPFNDAEASESAPATGIAPAPGAMGPAGHRPTTPSGAAGVPRSCPNPLQIPARGALPWAVHPRKNS
ncbi:hypothetical protein GCM10011366_12830 [Ornithinimicrobium tianjinense]|uniref:Uncharacterized protein n=1 Tax=Ornithinimicrobium tianjinense TaxID=1195761 RepID=A0A917BK00_9MICO|nr:hypothetical protein GCM10011366_12830 [Ornithinimicrobium tianjinense]